MNRKSQRIAGVEVFIVSAIMSAGCSPSIIIPSTSSLSIIPSAKTLAVGNNFSFSASGGTPPYTYSVASGGGSVSASTGSFTAPGTSGSSVLRVTDSRGLTQDATVTINPALTISPSSMTVSVGSTYPFLFQSAGGVPDLSYSILSGSGSINGTSGAYTPSPWSAGTMTLRVTDSLGNAADATVRAIPLRTNGTVNAILKNGTSWYIGGNFTAINPFYAPKMIALDLSGNPVWSCDLQSGFNGNVSAIVSDGASLYVGGDFTTYQGQSANYLAKLNATTCALDTTFSPPASNGFNSMVAALAVSGTSLYVGGHFTAYRGIADSANRLAKLDLTTGAIDTTFSPVGASANGFSDWVNALAINDTSLYVGGQFTAYRGIADSANRLAKLDLTTGAIDTTFSPVGASANGFSDWVNALAVNDTSLYVGGWFTDYRGVVNSANRLAKLDLTTGAIDTTFSPVGLTTNGFGNPVFALAVSGTSLYAGGQFTAYKGGANSANYLAKLDLTSGAIDTTFSPVGATANGFNSSIGALAVHGTSLYVGGIFTAYKGIANSANRLAKLDLTSGAIDTTFKPNGSTINGFTGEATSLLVYGSTLYVGGAFTLYGGQSARGLAKLDASTWALDTTFSPPEGNGFGGAVTALVASGTSLYVGGDFTAYKNVANSANRLAKLDLTSGAIDTTFSPVGATANGFGSGTVYALAVNDTSLYVGGSFTAYKGVANSANRLAKLDLTSGTIDTTFSPVGATANGFGSIVYALAVNGTSLYAGGLFTAYKGVANSANYLAKLDLTSGAIDTTFSPVGATANGFGGNVYALAVSDTSLYVGGLFTAYKGVTNSANRLAKLDLTSGTIDTAFSPVGATANGFGGTVNALAVSGTSLYAGGYFTTYKGVADSANRLAKLDLTSGAIDTTFSPVGATANGLGGVVSALAISGASLYVGGGFESHRGNPAYYFVPLSLTTGILGEE